jgi:hypothetical protein
LILNAIDAILETEKPKIVIFAKVNSKGKVPKLIMEKEFLKKF